MTKKTKQSTSQIISPKDQATPENSAADCATDLSTVKPIGIPRVISLIVLVAVLLMIGVLFFRVMASFLVPLFLAAVLAVISNPLHLWICKKLPGRRKLSALVATGIISLLVLAPLTWFGWRAYIETSEVITKLSEEEAREEIALLVKEQATGWEGWYQDKFDPKFDLKETSITLLRHASDKVVSLGLTSLKAAAGFLFGLSVMVFALYYFFADGPSMLEALMHLSPMDDNYERELLHQFATVSRAVVLATLITAVAQGLLAGIGYYAIQFYPVPPVQAAVEQDAPTDILTAELTAAPSNETTPAEPVKLPVFLLTMLTMVMSIVPFIGAMAVWAPVAMWVMFVVPGGFWPGLILAIYCLAIVSSADNVIKPYVLSGQSNLHPLLALLSVLGGVQLLGPIGILVGPMLVAFMQALLGMLRKELDDFNNTEPTPNLDATAT